MADTEDPEEVERALLEGFGDAAKMLILETTAELVKRCPVQTGHARANFIPSAGAPSSSEAAGSDRGLQAAGIAEVMRWQFGEGDLFIANNVRYIDRLIAGSSQQAPPGWDLQAIAAAVATTQQHFDALDIDVTSRGRRPVVTVTKPDQEG